MALQPGTRIGPYEITSSLGAGGMGEVYRATDTNLKRAVAIKILPAALSADPDRVARFQREAEVLALLNHPNIAAVHGLERTDGVAALVMELVEGPTLADRLNAGALALDEALPIAKQIAEALEAAHDQGIIHRDLKPANVKVRPDGVVKVLDFGLARASDPVGSGAGTQSAAITSPAITEAGIILGTAAYMAPEQAKGKPVDRRADIFAFGCVLYEMLSGRRAFPGDSASETTAAVLRAEPDWAALPSDVPPALCTLLRRCLQKEARDRLPHIGVVRLELAEPGAPAAPDGSVRVRTRSSHNRFASALLAFAGLVAGAVLVSLWYRSQAMPPLFADPVTFRIASPTGLFSLPPSVPEIALSPDGRQLAFVAVHPSRARQIWIRRLDTATLTTVKGGEEAAGPLWSPDGRHLAFFRAGGLWRLEVATGQATAVSSQTGLAASPSWSRTDRILFADQTGALSRTIQMVAATGGEPRPVTTLAPDDVQHLLPHWLPDARHFLFTRISKRAADTGLYVGSVESSDVERVAPIAERVLYATGHLIYTRGETVFAQPFDVATRRITGDPVTLAGSAGLNGSYASLAVSENGTLSYGGVNPTAASRLQLIDRQGRVIREVLNDAAIADVRASRDGRQVAFVTIQGMVHGTIFTIELTRGLPVRMASAESSRSDRLPIWSPDGNSVQFTSATLPGPVGGFEIRRRRVDRPEEEELVATLPPPSFVTDWAADGEQIVYQTGLPWGLHRFAVSSKQSTPLVVGPSNQTDGRISPNGRILAFVSDESGRDEVYLQPFLAAGRRQRVTIQGGREPKWREDSRELFYRAADGALMAVTIAQRDGELVPGTPTRIVPTMAWADRGGSGLQRTFDVLPGGQQFVVNTFPPDVAAPEITVIANWPALLRQ